MEVELDAVPPESTYSCDICEEFPVIDATSTYSDYFTNFPLNNQACLIKNVSVDWESSKLWVTNGTPNFTYLTSHYGELKVPVHDCNKSTTYEKPQVTDWSFKSYVDYWKQDLQSPEEKAPLLYLKDWHLQNQLSCDYFYQVPKYFASDWLNEYLVENSKDDYRFVYMGVKGTWTPFHADVMTSYSWSVNICGQKRWLLLPPGEESRLCNKQKILLNDITNLKRECKCFEVIQNPGDAVFVPSNWHHQVWNTEDTISINHNWINGTNLKVIWLTMEKILIQVKEEIKDCQDMENFLEHCQLMLRASFCINFEEFYLFVAYIAKKRLQFIERGESVIVNGCKFGRNHCIFDLQSIKFTLLLLVQHEDIEKTISLQNISKLANCLINKIDYVLKKNSDFKS